MRAISALAVLALSTTSALADGPYDVPVVPVAPMAHIAAEPDWSGTYVGLFYAAASGEMFDIGGPYVLNDNGNFFGGFIGYRRDLGDYVVGGEISSSFGVDLYQAAFPSWAFDRVTDLRVSVGRDFGRALVYLAGGYTTTAFSVGPTNYTYDGWNAGIGIDYMVTDSFFAGAEYVYRSVARTDNPSWNATFGSVQLRGGFRF